MVKEETSTFYKQEQEKSAGLKAIRKEKIT